MPVSLQSGGELLISFYRGDEIREQHIADDGVRAVSVAMRMLALRDALQPGDVLTVQSYSPKSSST